MGADIRDTRQSPELCRLGRRAFQHRGHRLCVQTIEMKHSPSLILVWRVAEFEARHAKASTIEPNHLLLGLCKVVDLDLPSLLPRYPRPDEVLEELLREVRRLRTVYRAAGLDAKTFRRKLRRLRPNDVLPGRFGTIAPEFGRQAGFRRCGTFRPTRQQRGLSRPPALRDVACG